MFLVNETDAAAIRAIFNAGAGPVNQTMIRPADRRWCEPVH
jgi:hypothetical protein